MHYKPKTSRRLDTSDVNFVSVRSVDDDEDVDVDGDNGGDILYVSQ